MKTISYDHIIEKVTELCLQAAFELPDDVLGGIQLALDKEDSPLGKSLLKQYMNNANIASSDRVPICQDTGFAVYFVELGIDLRVEGGMLEDAINEGTRRGYSVGYLRKSIVRDPVFDRTNTGDNTPAVVHVETVPGDEMKIVLAPKGGGSENMSAVAMLRPSLGREGIIDFVVESVTGAGGNPCPPTVVGIGIGGTFEKVAYLAKRALIREMGAPNPDPNYAAMEAEILERLNASGVGPQGLGGGTTAFAVHIEQHPCHIASLPVAVNLNCHAARHAEVVLQGSES